MNQYVRGETPKLWAVIKTQTISDDGDLTDGSLTNPAGTIKCIIWDCVHNVVQAESDATFNSTGKYYYTGYTIGTTAKVSDLDPYEYEFRAVDGSSKKTVKTGYFMVKEHIA